MFDEITRHYDLNGKRVFVGGCGYGVFEEWLFRSSINPSYVVGMDFLSEKIEIAKTKVTKAHFVVGDIRDTKLPDGSFDVAVLIDTLHHVPDPVRALKEMGRIAKDVILYEANALNVVRRWNDWRSNGVEPNSFYKWELRGWLRELGFDRILIKNTHCIPRFTPDAIFGFMEKLEKILEKIPVLKEMTGALFVLAENGKSRMKRWNTVEAFYQKRSSWRNPKEENFRFKKATRLADVPMGAKVLDVGCRDGLLKNHLDESVIYHGIDIVNGFKRKDITIQDITQGTDFKRGFFDYVFCIDVLEHLINPFFVLREIRRILKPDGVLVLSVPNPYHFKEIVWNLLKIKDRQGHIFSWTKQTMQKLAEFCGFQLLDTSGTYLIPPIGCNNIMTRSVIYKFQKGNKA